MDSSRYGIGGWVFDLGLVVDLCCFHLTTHTLQHGPFAFACLAAPFLPCPATPQAGTSLYPLPVPAALPLPATYSCGSLHTCLYCSFTTHTCPTHTYTHTLPDMYSYHYTAPFCLLPSPPACPPACLPCLQLHTHTYLTHTPPLHTPSHLPSYMKSATTTAKFCLL